MHLDERFRRYRQRLEAIGQGQVLRFWGQLSPGQQQELLDDLDRVDLDQVAELVGRQVAGKTSPVLPSELTPVAVLPRRPGLDQVGRYADAVSRGQELIARGAVACLTAAGGEGTRLDIEGPKGALPISPVRNKSLFQLFAEFILAVRRRHNCAVPWYIMTSASNDAASRAFFEQHGYFGLPEQDVIFFRQGLMPVFSPDGKMLLAAKHRLALSPDGHGGVLTALAGSGGLEDMARRGVEYISYFQVDNPLVMPVDPLFIGLHGLNGSEMSCKVISKSDDLERLGSFVAADGKVRVIEYSELPTELARARNADGSRRFDAGNPAIHILSRSFVERLTADRQSAVLGWHRAEKKVRCLDETGRQIDPDRPNAVKLEMFIFDALPLAKRCLLLETYRAEEFSPIKARRGTDSLETARRDMVRRAAAWLEAAGCDVPRRADGEPDAVLEISPLLATDRFELCERLSEPPSIARGEQLYLE